MVRGRFIDTKGQNEMAAEALQALEVSLDEGTGEAARGEAWQRYCEIRNELVLNYIGMIRTWVGRKNDRFPEHSFDDMLQLAVARCLELFPKYRPELGHCMSPFLEVIVRQTLSRFVHMKDRVVVLPATLNAEGWEQSKRTRVLLSIVRENPDLGSCLEEAAEDLRTPDPLDAADLRDRQEQLQEALKLLRQILPGPARVVDRVLAGHQFRRIADDTGELHQTVHSRYLRGVRMLRNILLNRVGMIRNGSPVVEAPT